MADLEIRNLHVQVEGREILKGVDLSVSKGEIHALMGPNGSGKSTLANTIMGHPGLEVTEGQIIFKGEDITDSPPDERARIGLFMAFQYPVSVPGVTVTKYLRTVMNAHREADGLDPVSLKDFRKQVEAAMELVDVPREFTTRYLNEGFSGGEKKRMEILQLALQQRRRNGCLGAPRRPGPVPDPLPSGAGLPRFGGHGADAVGGARRDGADLPRVEREHPPRGLSARSGGDRGVRGRATGDRRLDRLVGRGDGVHEKRHGGHQ